MADFKRIEFRGDALKLLRGFPEGARSRAGFQLEQVQRGLAPDDWKPMNTIGAGACEIRVRAERGTFRVIYVAKFSEAVFVLHCFEKKSRKTSATDLELARQRYKQLLGEYSL